MDVPLQAPVPSDIGEDDHCHASRWDSQHGLYYGGPYLTFQCDDFLQFPHPLFGASGTTGSWGPEPLDTLASAPRDGHRQDSEHTGSDNTKPVLQPSSWHQCPDCHKQFTAERLR
jgi:hypothetical protein